MELSLVVVRAFGPHAPGDVIEDEDAMRRVLESEHADRVVQVVRAPRGEN